MRKQDDEREEECEKAMPDISKQCRLTVLALCTSVSTAFSSGVDAFCAAAENRAMRGDGAETATN